MADKMKVDLKKCLARAKRDGTFYENVDFTSASEGLRREFNITEKKRLQLVNFLKQSIERTKVKEFKKRIDPEYPRIVRKNTSHQVLREHAENLPTTKMTKYMRLAILKSIHAPKLEQAWPNVLNDVLEEVKAEYLEVTHEVFMLNEIIV